MGKFYLTDGPYLVGTGECQDGMEANQSHNGYQVNLGVPPAGMLTRPTPEQGYDRKRAQSYPDVGEQMDALWHGMHDGLLPRVEPFYSNILSVKQRYPKPSN